MINATQVNSCNTAIPQYYTISYDTIQYHAIPYNTMQYHSILCNTMQYHATKHTRREQNWASSYKFMAQTNNQSNATIQIRRHPHTLDMLTPFFFLMSSSLAQLLVVYFYKGVSFLLFDLLAPTGARIVMMVYYMSAAAATFSDFHSVHCTIG